MGGGGGGGGGGGEGGTTMPGFSNVWFRYYGSLTSDSTRQSQFPSYLHTVEALENF